MAVKASAESCARAYWSERVVTIFKRSVSQVDRYLQVRENIRMLAWWSGRRDLATVWGGPVTCVVAR